MMGVEERQGNGVPMSELSSHFQLRVDDGPCEQFSSSPLAHLSLLLTRN